MNTEIMPQWMSLNNLPSNMILEPSTQSSPTGFQLPMPSTITPVAHISGQPNDLRKTWNISDEPESYMNLCISRIPNYMTDELLDATFSAFVASNLVMQGSIRPGGNPVVSAKVIRDVATGMSKGYGFVLFRHPFDAHAALQHPILVPAVDLVLMQRNAQLNGQVLPPGFEHMCERAQLHVQVAKHTGHNIIKDKLNVQSQCSRVYIGNIPFFVSQGHVRHLFETLASALCNGTMSPNETIGAFSIRRDTAAHMEYFHRMYSIALPVAQAQGGASEVRALHTMQNLDMPPSFIAFSDFADPRLANEIIIKSHGKQPFPLTPPVHWPAFGDCFPLFENPDSQSGRVVLLPPLHHWLHVSQFLQIPQLNRGFNEDYPAVFGSAVVPPLFVKLAESKATRDERVKSASAHRGPAMHGATVPVITFTPTPTISSGVHYAKRPPHSPGASGSGVTASSLNSTTTIIPAQTITQHLAPGSPDGAMPRSVFIGKRRQ